MPTFLQRVEALVNSHAEKKAFGRLSPAGRKMSVLICPNALSAFLSGGYRQRSWIRHGEPIASPAGRIARAVPLAYDALAPECARSLEDNRARSVEDAVQRQLRPAVDQQPRQLRLALLDRLAPQIVAIESEQIEGACRVSMLASAK